MQQDNSTSQPAVGTDNAQVAGKSQGAEKTNKPATADQPSAAREASTLVG